MVRTKGLRREQSRIRASLGSARGSCGHVRLSRVAPSSGLRPNPQARIQSPRPLQIPDRLLVGSSA